MRGSSGSAAEVREAPKECTPAGKGQSARGENVLEETNAAEGPDRRTAANQRDKSTERNTDKESQTHLAQGKPTWRL